MTAADPRLNAGDYLPGDVEEGPVSLPQRVLDHVWADGKTTRQAIDSAARASSSQAGLAAVKYGPTAPPAARPFQVGDRVRITDHNRHRVTPDAQHAFEGIVSRIDPGTAPESEYVFGPYLWIDTEPFVGTSGTTHTATFCPLTDDLTAAADSEIGRSIELLEPAPTDTSGGAVTDQTPALSEAPTPDHGPLAATLSDRTLAKVPSRPAHVPSIVMLDRDAAAQHLADEVEGLLSRFSEGLEIFLPVRQALADYRETIR